MPSKVSETLGDKRGLQNVIGNINWLSIGVIFRNIVGLVVSAWIARYLGPDNFGVLNYVISFVALFSTLSTLGLGDISIKKFLSKPKQADKYLGTTLFMKFVGSLLMVLASSLSIYFLRRGDSNLLYFTIILSLGYIFKSFDVIDLWFQSEVKSKYSVYANLLAFLMITIIRVILVLTGKALLSFVITYILDFLLTAFFLILFYSKKGTVKLKNWKIDKGVIVDLLTDCWPLILSGFATMIYMKIDQIMIGNMLGDKELGVYSSAIKLSESWYFIPTVITSSVFPAILNAKRKSEELYKKRLQILYDFFTWFTIFTSIVISFLSPFIINLLYGKEYIDAAPVLAIHIWSGFAVFLGIASGKYLITENMTRISLFRTIVGAIVNVISNIILIPKIGILGAAISTFLSYTASTFSVLFIPSARGLGVDLLKSFNIFRIIKEASK